MFTEFAFPRELTEPLGLQPAKLHSLGQMVVLVGPNGAGKSRYLQLVEKLIDELRELEERIDLLQARLNPPKGTVIVAIPGSLERELKNELARIPLGVKGNATKPRTVKLTYEKWDYGRHPLSVPPDDVDRVVAANQSGGFGNAVSSVYDYFFEVARAMYEAKHPDVRDLPGAQRGLEDARAFNQILKALLFAEIEPELNEKRRVVARFRGRRFDPRELSMGELVLAGWAIVLHRQKAWLRGACVLIDEPENHLHPDVCIRALNALRNEILGPQGQIWLATHSVPLIAYAGIESVHFVDNGTIEYAGNKIGKVLDRLLGGEEGRTKLRALMADADEIAFDNFAAQCLLPPGVASAQEGDPQQVQMVKAAKNLGAGKENIRILDFAAGRGRLAAALRDAGQVANRRFTYYAFQDPRFSDPSDRRECVEHIRSLAQPGEPESYLDGTLEGFTVRDAERMDLAVMCNVLHEIPVGDWQHVFERIYDVLVDDGHLVILEDQTPSVGELPHADGYVILNEQALQHLFGSRDAVLRLSVEKEGRLTAFAIPRAFLRRVTPQTVGRALASVKRMAEERIRFIRDKRREQRSFQDGRLHAHYALLYANALLASRLFPDPDAQAN